MEKLDRVVDELKQTRPGKTQRLSRYIKTQNKCCQNKVFGTVERNSAIFSGRKVSIRKSLQLKKERTFEKR
jgi:hypothetical protein